MKEIGNYRRLIESRKNKKIIEETILIRDRLVKEESLNSVIHNYLANDRLFLILGVFQVLVGKYPELEVKVEEEINKYLENDNIRDKDKIYFNKYLNKELREE